MKTRFLFIVSILLAIFLAGCGTDPAGPAAPDPDTSTDVDVVVCVVDCGTTGDVTVEIDCGDQCEDASGPDIGCENKCAEGQVKCTMDDAYKECVPAANGCLEFAGATVFCPVKEECICGEVDTWCDPGTSEPCVCVEECEGKDCGPNGCGGSCGDCAGEFVCNLDEGSCIPKDPDETCEECVEACAVGSGINCCEEEEQKCNGIKIIDCTDSFPDEDGCACWKWPDTDGEDCDDPLQVCLDLPEDLGACVCEFLTCDNGCCPTAGYTTCDPQGDCCVPDCDGKECGNDGCGGSCGECLPDYYCVKDESYCSPICVPECTTPGDTDCDGDFAFNTCVVEQVGGEDCNVWSAISDDCPPQHVCEEGVCECVPNCQGKNCGDDGCGGDCGACYLPNICNDGDCGCVCVDDDYLPVCDLQNCETYPSYCKAICAGVTEVDQGLCDCGCTSGCTETDWAMGPVCGVDGVTYATFCDLRCSDDVIDNGCESADDCTELEKVGECGTSYCLGTDPPCPVDYNPVCSTKNVTYWNYCCFLATAPDDDEYFCQGECAEAGACPDAAMICSPVCGFNDEWEQVSYFNIQFLDCLGGSFFHDSECCDWTTAEEDLVCADNNGTMESYLNDGVMSCIDPGLEVLYSIPQDAYGGWQDMACDDCQCDLSETDESTWLCGSDFNTYANQCALNCFQQDNPALSSIPICDSGCGFMLDECPCPPGVGGAVVEPVTETDPGTRGVCGDDGYTYSNACDATYNGVQVVLDEWCEECQDLCLGEAYTPLCCKIPGMDTGATYPNACVVDNCSDVYETGDCMAGECCLFAEDCDDGNPATEDVCNGESVCENN